MRKRERVSDRERERVSDRERERGKETELYHGCKVHSLLSDVNGRLDWETRCVPAGLPVPSALDPLKQLLSPLRIHGPYKSDKAKNHDFSGYFPLHFQGFSGYSQCQITTMRNMG